MLASSIIFLILFFTLCFYLRNKTLDEQQGIRLIKNFIVFSLVLYFIYSITCFLERDEIEHIYSSWLVYKGEVPYSDFFQHHHPLLWYIFAPVFLVGGESIFSVILIRTISFSFFLGTLVLVYKSAVELTGSKKMALYSLTAILSFDFFSRVFLTVRPDGLMTLLAVGSFYHFLLFFKTHKNRNLLFSGILLAFSFMALQKAVFYILPFLSAIIFLWIKKRLTSRQILLLGASSLIPVIVFITVFGITGYFNDYLIYNWFYNFLRSGHNPVYLVLSKPRQYIIAANIFLLFGFSLMAFFKNIRTTPLLLNISFAVGLTGFIFISLLSTVFIHYYILVMPFLFLPVGYFLSNFFGKYRISVKYQILFFSLLYAFCIPSLTKKISTQTLFSQMKTNQYVQNKCGEHGTILMTYPGVLFVGNVHFKFFNNQINNKSEDILKEITENPLYQRWATEKMRTVIDFDPKKIIEEKRPLFVLAKKEFIEEYNLIPILEQKYKPSVIINLYELKEMPHESD